MATVVLVGDELELRLSRWEKVAGLRGDLRVALAAVREARVEPDGPAAARGLRAPGLAVPGLKVGTWRRRGYRGFVVVRRGIPAVRVELADSGYDELLVSRPTPTL